MSRETYLRENDPLKETGKKGKLGAGQGKNFHAHRPDNRGATVYGADWRGITSPIGSKKSVVRKLVSKGTQESCPGYQEESG